MKYCFVGIVLSILTLGCSSHKAIAQVDESLGGVQEIKIPGSEEMLTLVPVAKGQVVIASSRYEISSFYIGATEITYDQYILFQDKYFDNNEAVDQSYDVDAVSRPSPPYEDFTKGMGKHAFPAVSMTQQAALRYCQWLYAKTGKFFRLPTEAEWQLACEQGQLDEANLADQAWYFENANEKFQKVAQKEPNQLGLYDMLGNVAEWTIDDYQEDYQAGTHIDPMLIPTRKHSRTVKGGSYLSEAEACNCKTRIKSSPLWQRRDPQIPKSKWWNPDSPFIGFRVVMPVQQMSKAEIDVFFKKVIID